MFPFPFLLIEKTPGFIFTNKLPFATKILPFSRNKIFQAEITRKNQLPQWTTT